MREIKVKSTLPIYLVGVIWVVYALILPLYRITDICIAAGMSLLAYIAATRLVPDKTEMRPEEFSINRTGVADVDAALQKGRDYLEQMNILNQRIQSPAVNKNIEVCSEVGREIFNFIGKNPSDIRRTKTFIDYYFPTAIKLLQEYADLQNQPVKGENINRLMAKIEDIMITIEKAFAAQLDSLYEGKVLDVGSDIDVLSNILAAEGLQGGMGK